MAQEQVPEPEPGDFDNRLSLDPNDQRWAELIADWEDGGEYTVTLRIVQISPGEFEVTELSEATAPNEEETQEVPEEEVTEGEPASTAEATNPAISALLRRR